MPVSADHNLWFIFVSNTVYWIPSVCTMCAPCACGYNSVLANRKTGSVKRIPPECFRKDSHAIHKRGGIIGKPKEMIFSSVRNNRPICLFSYDSLPMAFFYGFFPMVPFLCLPSYDSLPMALFLFSSAKSPPTPAIRKRVELGANKKARIACLLCGR